MKSRFILLVISNFILLLASCHRDPSRIGNQPPDNGNTNSSGTVWTPSPVITTVTGLIVDENNQPFANVTVRAGNNTAITGIAGNFRFNNISLDKYSSLVTAEATGYFKGYRVFPASGKGTNFIKIQLLKKTAIGSINATTGGTVTSLGYSVVFPANAIVNKSTGAAYTGTVSVLAKVIDPTSVNIAAIVPGSFMGTDSAGKQTVLESFGMIAVELQGAGGEPLQMAADKTARIDFRIPATKEAVAPNSIPLWYIDENTGLWKQEGTAVRNGSIYSGTVKHFSFWNCDNSGSNPVFLELTIKDLAGRPIPYSGVRLTATYPSGNRIAVVGYTDSTGYASGLVPSNVPITMDVLNECYTTAFSKNLPAMTQATNLGTIQADLGSAGATFAGNVFNCNGQPFTNGWVDIYLENKTYKATIDNTGAFSITVTYCNHPVAVLIPHDITTSQDGLPYNITIGVSDISHIRMDACGSEAYSYTTSVLAGDPTKSGSYVDATGIDARFGDAVELVADTDGNVFVADKPNHCIRKITPAGVVTTFAGNGTQGYMDGTGTNARFNQPSGLTIDNANNLFVADEFNHRIRKITPAGVVTTFAGDGVAMLEDGPAVSASFWLPYRLVIDGGGTIYVAELGTQTVRKITSSGTVSTLAGNGLSGYSDGQGPAAQFNTIGAIVLNKTTGNLYATDGTRIRKITPGGLVSTFAGDVSGNVDGPLANARFGTLVGMTIDPSGNIYVTDYTYHKMRKINTTTNIVSLFAGNGALTGFLDGPAPLASLNYPKGVTLASNGNFYVAEGNFVRKIKPN